MNTPTTTSPSRVQRILRFLNVFTLATMNPTIYNAYTGQTLHSGTSSHR
jgi:hypothetical protein